MRLFLLSVLTALTSTAGAPVQPAPSYEVYAIQYGVIKAFRTSGLVAGADTARRTDIAMMVWLLKGPNGRNVLVDAGFQRDDLIQRWKPADFVLPSEAVARAGVKPEAITDVILSHIHWDHADGASLFPNARIWLQKEEYEHHIDSSGNRLANAIDVQDAAMLAELRKKGRVHLIDGDAREIIPGITVYIGGKHTFQSQYAGVRTAAGTVVIASDNAYLYENLEKHLAIAQTLDAASNLAAQSRMAAIATNPGLIVPGHDPTVFVRFPAPGNGVARIQPVPAARAPGDTTYDIVIRNGRVLDGQGNPWILADVAIRDGRFVKIGKVTSRGTREIDATGKYVSPGWIDMMDQSGAVLPRNGSAENKLQEGVTTAIGGEGGTPVPAGRVGEYFASLERQGISINFGSYFSETQARVAVLGQSARKPTTVELDRMRAIMDTAMRGGAMGMTTALIYPPSSYSSTDELVEVARGAAKYGGIYASHIRGEGKEVVEAVNEAIAVGERAGMPVEVFHLKVAHKPGWGILMDSVRQTVEAARARGVDVAADLYVYTAGGTGLEATIPSWAHEGGTDSLKARLANAAIRARLKGEVTTGSPGWWNIIEAAGGWEGVVLVNARNPANVRYEQKTIAQIARETGKDPADAAWDLVAQGSGRVMAIYHMMSEGDIETALRFPWTSIGSDAGAVMEIGVPDQTGLPHPRSFGNFPRVIAKYVKERHVLTLSEAVRKMTGWPATRMRLANRGTIAVGNWADVTIFDYDALQDRATYERPMDFPTGIEWVLVNGSVTIDHGKHTGAKAGAVLRGPGADRR